ncbi:HEAT repeat domain-containing protein [Fictibacillus sp. 18YEL24]|uniref:HEAT repeat domain-containing protein n=1 Tax=Fictibacillus sp. 18YEL24 TaxID=2745875 RepID=UPI0018CEEE3F|nr:HEAT repeat domain-containing protein [Fictibacillus sp. 18YEL24]MBH0170072.1 HEAT repeat domain-containing protein [Fictibacillus sp. 18YEL24]
MMLSQEIFLLVIIACILLSVLTSMFLYLLIKKTVEISKEKQITNYKNQVHQTIYDYLYRDQKSRLLVPDSTIKFTTIERILTEYSTVIEGEGKGRISSLADEIFHERYEIILNQNNWSRRMNVLYKVDGFKMGSLSEVLKRKLRDQNTSKEEKLIIFRCLANNQECTLSQLFQSVSAIFSVLEYRSILNRVEDELFTKLVDDYCHYPERLKLAIIDMIGIQKKLDLVAFLENQLDDERFEIRIRSMKAIGEVGFLSDSEVIGSFAKSDRWEERLMAAKVIGKTRALNGLEILEALIKDSSWRVRAEAAKSFLSYNDGLERLYDIRFTSDDPFARDMASEWIERGIEDGYSY